MRYFPRLIPRFAHVKSKYISKRSGRMSRRKGRLNKRGAKCNRLGSFKDNTLTLPCYKWLVLNEAVRETGKAKTRAAYNRISSSFHMLSSLLSHCYSMILRALCSLEGSNIAKIYHARCTLQIKNWLGNQFHVAASYHTTGARQRI